MKKTTRKNLYVDSAIQGAIIKRVLAYWFACLLFLTLPMVLTMTIMQPEILFVDHIPTVLKRFWPVYLILVLMLPFLVRDALSLSNRFCGPMTRLLGGIKQYNETGVYNDIKFRERDFWKPVATAINTAMQKSQGENKA